MSVSGGGRSPLASMDRTKPSIARVYDAILGGKDNFEIDRALVAKLLDVFPQARDMATENRKWLVRTVRWLAGAGIDQFLDIGCGLPTQENTHEVAQRVNPTAVVCYVDSDPAVAAFGRALLEGNEYTHFAEADLTEPDALFAHDIVTRHLDLSRPIMVMHCSTIHHVSDEQDPYTILQRYIQRLPSGSYLALTHFWDPEQQPLTQTARDLERAGRAAGSGTGWWRTRDTIQSYFDGLEMVEPGLVRLHEWWPDGPAHEPSEADDLMLAGVAHKP